MLAGTAMWHGRERGDIPSASLPRHLEGSKRRQNLWKAIPCDVEVQILLLNVFSNS